MEEFRRRRRRGRDKHLTWKKWKEEEALSHGQIVQRWKDKVGEEVSKDAVAKAIARLKKEESS
jgi:hypothetical protein